MSQLIYTLNKKRIWSTVALNVFVLFAVGFSYLPWISKISFPFNIAIMAAILGYLGFNFAKAFKRLASVVSCPHCKSPLQPVVEAAKYNKITMNHCPCCGGHVEA